MKRRVFGLLVLVITLGVGYARNAQTSDGYWHDEPCCMGEMDTPGFGCWHNIQFAGLRAAVRAEESSRVANVKAVRQY